MTDTEITLCFPDGEKTCFACCPPIRPAGYEHVSYENITKRTLRENTAQLDRTRTEVSPIIGFSCWALGYLDRNCKLVGCLLHPAQNMGVDLRYRIDYWDKCRRETCTEAKTFSRLTMGEKRFLLRLSDGLDSFSYSSRKTNPLFNILNWGMGLLSRVASEEQGRIHTRGSFFRTYPLFSTTLSPRANAYMINRLIDREGVRLLKDSSCKTEFERLSGHISLLLQGEACQADGGSPVHFLDFDQEFLDLLRLSGRILRITREQVVLLKKIVDNHLVTFQEGLFQKPWSLERRTSDRPFRN